MDEQLKTLAEMPLAAVSLGLTPMPQAWHESRLWYKCSRCKEWIMGQPREEREDSLGPLCGRRGTTYFCLKCNSQIAFCGVIS